MDAVERWKRLTHPQCVADYSLSVTIDELEQTEEGRRIIEEEIKPWLPPEPDPILAQAIRLTMDGIRESLDMNIYRVLTQSKAD